MHLNREDDKFKARMTVTVTIPQAQQLAVR
jgi:hypothetical protein